jgi:hypothetical protein
MNEGKTLYQFQRSYSIEKNETPDRRKAKSQTAENQPLD